MNSTFLSFFQRKFACLLYPLSLVYAGLMSVRRHIYWKYFKSIDIVSIPVIAIGNIAWGGTGKTPIVDYILHYALQKNILPTVISRGYKASPPYTPFLISPTTNSAYIAGDEPLMLARKYPSITCIIDPKRNRAAHYAMQNCKQDCFLLDDAFQHMSLVKDTTICLLRPEDLLDEWNHVIPYGSWRENEYALSYANAFCMKISPLHFEKLLPTIEKRLEKYPSPLYTFTVQITSLINFHTKEEVFTLDSEYSLFSAIGNPQSFYDSIVTFLGKKPKHHYTKKDHASFSLETLPDMPLICTEKDATKILDSISKTIFVTSTKVIFGPYIAPYNFDIFLDNALKYKK